MRWKNEVENSDVQVLDTEYPSQMFSVVFRSETSHKLRSIWAGPSRVIGLIAPALTDIKLVYYPGEEKLVSLDELKL